MRSFIIICVLFASANCQGSGSGDGQLNAINASLTLTTTLNGTFGNISADFNITFCNEIETLANNELSKTMTNPSALCTVLNKVEGSIIVTFTVDVDGQSTDVSVNTQALINALATPGTIAGYGVSASVSDLNECSSATLNDCLSFQTCVNTPGFFECQCDPAKYDENGDASSCVDPISVTCEAGRMTINTVLGYLTDLNIGATELRLIDETCSGSAIGTDAVIVINDLTSCGTTKSESSTHITYTNTISTQPKSTDVIITGSTLGATVSCSYPVGVTASLDPFQGTVSTIGNNNVTENGTFAVVMQAFTDSTFTSVQSELSFTTSESLYVEAALTTQDSDLFVNLQRCWATPNSASNNTLQYDLISEYCIDSTAVDGSVEIFRSGTSSRAQWAVQVFRFVGDSDTVYVHCELEICQTATCGQCTAARRRRSAQSLVVSSRLSRQRRQSDPNQLDEETLGPIYRITVETEGLDPIIIVLISVLLFLLITIFFVLLIVLLRRRRNREDKKSSVAFDSGKTGQVNTAYQM